MTDRSEELTPGVHQATGHEWDGIQELDTPLPRWWLWAFYTCIAFAIGYCIAYPAIPMLHDYTRGMLHWSSHGQFDTDMAKVQAERAQKTAALATTPIEQVDPKSPLMAAAIQGGQAAFRIYCVQCHGSGAAGRQGFYPSLIDDDWLWGGTLADIRQTITHGVRQPGDPATRTSQMPAFGRDGILTAPQIQDLVSFVRLISKQEGDSASAERGRTLFAANCAVCHGPEGKGDQQFGAPNLTDAIWLYGGDRATITTTITDARGGVMPAWGQRLDPATINMLAAYVHSLGGGK